VDGFVYTAVGKEKRHLFLYVSKLCVRLEETDTHDIVWYVNCVVCLADQCKHACYHGYREMDRLEQPFSPFPHLTSWPTSSVDFLFFSFYMKVATLFN